MKKLILVGLMTFGLFSFSDYNGVTSVEEEAVSLTCFETCVGMCNDWLASGVINVNNYNSTLSALLDNCTQQQ